MLSRDFRPIFLPNNINYHFTPDALIVSSDSPYKTYQEFVAAAKKNPGKMTLAGSPQYSAHHPALPDVSTFKELGLNWVDGAYRGIAMPMSTPLATQKKMSDYTAKLNADPATNKRLEDSGFVIVDIPLEKISVFMKEKEP